MADSMHDLALQLAETRGELRELILDVRSELRDQDRRLGAVEQEQGAQWRKLDALQSAATTSAAIRRTYLTVGAGLGTLGTLVLGGLALWASL